MHLDRLRRSLLSIIEEDVELFGNSMTATKSLPHRHRSSGTPSQRRVLLKPPVFTSPLSLAKPPFVQHQAGPDIYEVSEVRLVEIQNALLKVRMDALERQVSQMEARAQRKRKEAKLEVSRDAQEWTRGAAVDHLVVAQ